MTLKNRNIILVFFLIPILLVSKVYDFKSYSLENGLPQSQVFSLFQDDEAYMWVGTNGGGLARFDGKEFIKFSSNQGLYGISVTSTLIDQTGRLWVGTDMGLFYKDGKRFVTKKTWDEIENKPIEKILMDDNGVVYFFGTIGAVSYDGKNFERLRGVLPHWRIYDAIIHPSGSIFMINQESKVYEYNENSLIDFTPVLGAEGILFNKIANKKNGQIILASYDKLYEFKQELHEIKFHDQESIAINCLAYSSKNELWVGTDQGVFGIYGKETKHFNYDKGLLNNQVWTILEDREGNLWFGTDAGISVYVKSPFILYNKSDGLSSSYVWALLKDKDRILVGTENGINSLRNGRFEALDYPELKNTTILDMVKDRKGVVWIGTDTRGVFLLYPNGKLIAPAEINSKVTRGDMFKEDVNGHIWIVAYGEGLYKWDGGSLVHYGKERNIQSEEVIAVTSDFQGFVWVATYGGGIYKQNGSNFEKVDLGLDYQLPAMSLLPNGKKGMFIATYGQGIFYYEYKSKTCFNIDQKSEMAEGGILSLHFHKDELWAGTNSGLYQIKVSSAINLDIDLQFYFYDRSKGFLGLECNQARLLSEGNKLMIGTFKGLVVYEKGTEKVQLTPSYLNFSNIEINQKDTSYQSFFDLSPSQNNLKFKFVGINFSARSGITYQYFLEGHDKDWLEETEINEVRYNNLPSGDYVFRVRAKSLLTDWSQEKKIKIKINPPFYRTTEFIVSVVFLFIGGIILIFYMREKSYKHQQQQLEEKVLERTMEIMNQNQLLKEAKQQIETKSKEINSSIAYASRIQLAVMSDVKDFKVAFKESFVFLKPKELVSGDFFWYYRNEDYHLIGCCDCTGHGVPGAMMSMLGNGFLNQIVREIEDKRPHKILQSLNKKLHQVLEEGQGEDVNDGMDVTIVGIDTANKKVELSMAQRSCLYRSKDKLIQLKGDKIPVGGISDPEAIFSLIEIDFEEIDQLYLFSDGLVDQFGGPEGRKFMIRQFRSILRSIGGLPMYEQRATIKKKFEKWKGELEQVDDILVIGIDLKDYKSQ